MFGLGFGEILVILIIAFIFIGPQKLPEIAQNLGKGVREFNRARHNLMNEFNRAKDEVDPRNIVTKALAEETKQNDQPETKQS